MKKIFKFQSIKHANGDKETLLYIETDKNDNNDKCCLSSFVLEGVKIMLSIIKFALTNPELVIPFIEEIMNRLFYSIKNRTFFLEGENEC